MLPHDIFLFGATGLEATLKNVLELLPDEVSVELLGVTKSAEIERAAAALDESQSKALREIATLVVHGGRLEREDLDPILRTHGIRFGNGDSTHRLVFDLVMKLQPVVARRVLTEAIKPGIIASKGTFSDFKATDLDLSTVDILKLQATLESELEERFSKGSIDKRKVKVKADWNAKAHRLVIGIYFTRPKADGRDISGSKKKLVTRPFDRPAASTFVSLKRGRKRVIVTFRSPTSSSSQEIRAALSMAMWNSATAIEAIPMSAYDLQKFAKLSFIPKILKEYSKHVGHVALSDIRVSVHSGNHVTVTAPGRRADALADFKVLSKGAASILANGDVERVTIKFLSNEDTPKVLVRAEVKAHSIELDEQYRTMVEDHLESWGIRNDD